MRKNLIAFVLQIFVKLCNCHTALADCERRLESFARDEVSKQNLELPFNASNQADAVSHGLGVRNLFTLAIADRGIYPVRNDISEDETTSGTTPSPTLSWICSTLPEFHICGFATVCSICSLSGLVTRRPSANPLPLGEGALRHQKYQSSICNKM